MPGEREGVGAREIAPTPSRSDPTPPRCGHSGGVNANGEPCGALLGLSPITGLCRIHDPATAEEARHERLAGGAAAAETHRAKRIARESNRPEGLPPPPQTIEDVPPYASWAVDAVAKGPDGGGIDVRRAREITGLLKEFRSAVEKAELARQLRELQKELKHWKGKAADR